MYSCKACSIKPSPPRTTITSESASLSNLAIRKKKRRNIQEWQIQPKKYFLLVYTLHDYFLLYWFFILNKLEKQIYKIYKLLLDYLFSTLFKMVLVKIKYFV